jgi:hypothetical protein
VDESRDYLILEGRPTSGTPASAVDSKTVELLAGGHFVALFKAEGEFGPGANYLFDIYGGVARQSTSLLQILGCDDYSGITFSPNGRWLLIKGGRLAEANESLQFFLWDTQRLQNSVTGKVIIDQGPLERGFDPSTAWSPNSRFLAFFGGKVVSGAGLDWQREVTPVVFDTLSCQSRPIRLPVQSTFLTWTSRQTLLLSGSAKSTKRTENRVEQQRRNTQSFVPVLFEIDPVTWRTSVLVENASGPMAESPDGRWLAFYGTEQTNPAPEQGANGQSSEKTQEPVLVDDTGFREGLQLLDRKTHKRYGVPSISDYQELYWTFDGTRLITRSFNHLHILDLKTLRDRTLAELPNDRINSQGKSTDYKYEILGFTSDNRYVLTQVAHYGDPSQIQAVDLISGSMTSVVQVRSLDETGIYAAWRK